MDKSAQVPLDIRNTHHEELPRLLHACTPHIHRWRSADLTFKAVTDLQGLAAPAPLLKSLIIRCLPSEPVNVVPGLFGGEVRSLKSLVFRNVSIPLEPELLGGLTNLKIHSPSLHAKHSQITNLLTNSPRLVRLDLLFSQRRTEDNNEPSLQDAIFLPSLRSMALAFNTSTLQMLLLHLVVPSCSCLRLRSTLDQITLPIGPTIDFLFPLVREIETFTVNVGDDGIALSDPEQSLHVSFGSGRDVEATREVGCEVFLEMMRHLGPLDDTKISLSLGEGKDARDQILSYLATQHPEPSGDLRWPLSSLEFLTLDIALEDKVPINALARLISARSFPSTLAENREMEEAVVPRLPVPIDTVGCRYGVFGEVEDVLPEVMRAVLSNSLDALSL